MHQLKSYQKKSISSGWTRIDLLLMLYDKALASVEACEIALEAGDEVAFRKQEMQVRKVILAIFSGLKPEESEVANNIARLLEYVLFTFDQRRFEASKKILNQIREGFLQITDEANRMEREGEIEPMPNSDSFQSIA